MGYSGRPHCQRKWPNSHGLQTWLSPLWTTFIITIPRCRNNIINVATQHDDDQCNLQKFWNLEATGTEVESDIDKKFLDNYSEHCITCLQDGSYCARLPREENHPPLPSNFNMCWKRMRSLAYRLSQVPELLCI